MKTMFIEIGIKVMNKKKIITFVRQKHQIYKYKEHAGNKQGMTSDLITY
jgi:hypothetical protein